MRDLFDSRYLGDFNALMQTLYVSIYSFSLFRQVMVTTKFANGDSKF